MDNSILKETYAKFKAIGVVSEMGMMEEKNGKWESVPLRIVNTTRDEYVDGKATGKKIPCQKLRGSVTLKTARGLMEFRLNYCSKKSNGEDDQRWDIAKKIMETWVPAIDPEKYGKSGEPTTVVIQGRNGYGRTALSIYDRVGRDEKITSTLQWNADSCKRAEVGAKTGCTLYAHAFLKSFRPEMTGGVDPRETGRLIVEMYGADNHGQCYPIECFVEEELADDFQECFKPGQTLDCEFNRVMRSVGAAKPKKRTFGSDKGDVKVTDSFSKEELVLYAADEIEEPDVLEDEEGNPIKTNYIFPDAMNAAVKERNKMLEEKVKDKKNESNAPKTNLAASAKQASKGNSFGQKSVDSSDDFDAELPF